MDDVLKNDESMKFFTAFPTLASLMPSKAVVLQVIRMPVSKQARTLKTFIRP